LGINKLYNEKKPKERMTFPRRRIIKIAVISVFLGCTLFVNFFAVRMIMRYGVDTYFYDKLLVAYTIGGEKGLKIELDKIPVTDKSSRELMLANDFIIRLKTLTDPEAFLKDKVQKSRQKISSVRSSRNAAILIMLILFGWQLMANVAARKCKKSPEC
jgi:hypothetical protein